MLLTTLIQLFPHISPLTAFVSFFCYLRNSLFSSVSSLIRVEWIYIYIYIYIWLQAVMCFRNRIWEQLFGVLVMNICFGKTNSFFISFNKVFSWDSFGVFLHGKCVMYCQELFERFPAFRAVFEISMRLEYCKHHCTLSKNISSVFFEMWNILGLLHKIFILILVKFPIVSAKIYWKSLVIATLNEFLLRILMC